MPQLHLFTSNNSPQNNFFPISPRIPNHLQQRQMLLKLCHTHFRCKLVLVTQLEPCCISAAELELFLLTL